MRSSLKWFVLSISIIIPLTISFFLHFFGKNNYEVPIFHEERIGNYSFCFNKNLTFGYIDGKITIEDLENKDIFVEIAKKKYSAELQKKSLTQNNYKTI